MVREHLVCKTTNINLKIFFFQQDLARFSSYQIFVISVYVANFLRDVLSSIVEIIFNIILMYFLKRFYYDKIRLTGMPDERLSKIEKTNMIITIIISFLSILMHMVTFMVKQFCFLFKKIVLNQLIYYQVFLFSEQSFKLSKNSFSFVMGFSGVLLGFRHSINIFIFYSVNTAFREKFNYLVLDA